MRLLAFLCLMAAPASAAELVMVEEQGCIYCARWDAEIAPAYPLTPEGQAAPLRRVDIHALPEEVTFDSVPRITPTFVLVEDGLEVARLEGYPGDEFFWHLLAQMLDKLAAK